MDDLIVEFIAETREMLAAIERALVAWERDPSDSAQLDEIFRFIHTVKGNSGFFDLPRIEALSHAAESALSAVRSGSRKVDSALVDAVLAAVDRIGEMVEAVAAGDDIKAGHDGDLIAALSAEAEPVEVPASEPAAPESAANDDNRARRRAEAARTVRLPTTLVDQVMSGVSDMILVRNELERQLRGQDGDPALMASFGRLSSLLSELQSAMSRVRLQPIQTLLGSYERMIRDISAELGKDVSVEIESGQVELDREMIELLRDPLMHIIRNAIDHGLESPGERSAGGKNPSGRLLLSARQTGNEIRIAILDDGRGIDAHRVVAKAVERKVISAAQAAELDHNQQLLLICEPGLSTAREVTGISGRGVGMDVVRAAIERVGGKLQIVSTPGEGTRFVIDVPLTLSVVPSITVAVGSQVFAIPRSYVREIVCNSREVEVEKIGGVRHVEVRGELYPCLGLSSVLGIAGEDDPDFQTLVMVTMIDGSVFALCVDDIADHCDLVVRPVAPQIIATGYYVGVAQLNDGSPSLMLDMVGVAQAGGIVADKQARSLPSATPVANDTDGELAAVIVFTGLDGIRQAAPMSQVEKLVEVPLSEVGQGNGTPHVVFDGEVVPLHGFAGNECGDSLDILVLSVGGELVAYATAGQIDTCDVDLTSATDKTGRNLVLIGGEAVELLDLHALQNAGAVRPTCRLPADDGWTRRVLRPLVESAGYRVVAEGNAASDLEIVFEGEHDPEAPSKARERLVVDKNDNEDRAALAAAIHAARKRSLA